MKRRHLKGFCESQAIVCAYSLFVIFTYSIKLGWLAANYILRFLIRKIYTTYCIVYNKVHIKYFFLSLKCCRNDNYPASSLVSVTFQIFLSNAKSIWNCSYSDRSTFRESEKTAVTDMQFINNLKRNLNLNFSHEIDNDIQKETGTYYISISSLYKSNAIRIN